MPNRATESLKRIGELITDERKAGKLAKGAKERRTKRGHDAGC